MNNLQYRYPNPTDIKLLAEMNFELIQDEGHRNKMNINQLEERMSGWLLNGYKAIIFNDQNSIEIGYALYKKEPDWIYLRQFFIKRKSRRQGFGKTAIKWLINNEWKDKQRIRVETLINNSAAIDFWRAVGFNDYCLTLEKEN